MVKSVAIFAIVLTATLVVATSGDYAPWQAPRRGGWTIDSAIAFRTATTQDSVARAQRPAALADAHSR